jgi:hypothetical protein
MRIEPTTVGLKVIGQEIMAYQFFACITVKFLFELYFRFRSLHDLSASLVNEISKTKLIYIFDDQKLLGSK